MKGESPDGDPQPVYEAERGPKQESERHHRQRPDTILQLLGGDNGDQSQDRTDREVDAAGQDDEGHADGNDPNDGNLPRDVEQVPRLEKVGRQDGGEQDEDDQGQANPAFLQRSSRSSENAAYAASSWRIDAGWRLRAAVYS